MGSGFARKKKQQKELAEQFARMQEEMATAEYTGSAGNGLVTVVVSGEKNLKSITINPECVDPKDVEGLQDLILEAFKEVSKKIEENSPLPDMSPFGF